MIASEMVWEVHLDRKSLVTLSLPQDFCAVPVEVVLPSRSKLEWIIQVLPERDRAEMGAELLRAATYACRTGLLSELAETVLSWEATAEEIEDSKGPGDIRDDGGGERPLDIGELQDRLGN